MSYYIEVVPNRKYRPTPLLQKDWREGKKVKKTIAKMNHFRLLYKALKQLSKEK